METSECGVACLAMVLSNFGRHIPLEVLRTEGGSSRDGVSAADIVELANRHGLHAQAYSLEPHELAALPLPQILYWEFNHFVVLDYIGKDHFIILDPASGRRKISTDEFNRAFTGITITFERKTDFKKQRKKTSVIRFLFNRLRTSRGTFLSILLCHFALALIAVLLPGFIRIFIDEYLIQYRSNWLIPLLLAMVAIAFLRVGLMHFANYAGLMLETKLVSSMSAEFVWRLLRLPFRFFVSRSPAEVSGRAQHTNQVVGTINGPTVAILIGMLTLLIQLIAMATYNTKLMLFAVFFAIINLLLLSKLKSLTSEISQQMHFASGRAHSVNAQGFNLLEDYKATGNDTVLFERMMQAHVEFINAEQRHGALQKRLEVLSLIGREGFSIAILFAGALEVMNSNMSIGMLIGFQMLAEMFSQQLSAMLGLGTAIQSASGPIERLQDILDHKPDTKQHEGKEEKPEHLRGTLEAHNIVYGYSNTRPVINNLHVKIEEGQIVAVMGPTGSGKSTLVRLLLGMIPPSSGEIFIGGKPLAQISNASLRASIGYVDQAPYLPSGRMRDGLSLWDTTTTDEELKQAAETAMIKDVINTRPGGFDSRIGENGSGFSGGEKQRLAIARALAAAPSILFLDETNSGLDLPTEKTLLSNLKESGITTLIVTHRIATLEHCDRVIVLADGQITWDGPPDSLPESFSSIDQLHTPIRTTAIETGRGMPA